MKKSPNAKLLEEFKALNERKRWQPNSMTESDWARWKEMRREIDKALFDSSPDPAADSREFLRVPVTLEVRYWTRNELKDRYIPVLGEGGLFVSTVDPLPVGSPIDLELVLAQKGLSFKVKGEVVWIDQGHDPAKRGMGIKFVNMAYDQKQTIYGLVDDSLRQHLLERRKFARISAKLKVEFIFAEGQLELYTEDVGLGGLFIATDHLVPAGEQIRLVLHLPSRKPAVTAVGQVVRVVEEPSPGQPAGVGIHFVHLDPEAEQAIRDYIGMRVAGDLEAPEGELERRRHPRVKKRIKLRFQAIHSFGTGYSSNISSGGVFIHTPDPPPKGSKIKVTLVHPVSLQQLDLVGRVVRVVEPDPSNPAQLPGVGVSFEEINQKKRELLRVFLKEFALMETKEASEQDL